MNCFFMTDEDRLIKKKSDEYLEKISEYVKNDVINLLEYSYMKNYLENTGLVNSQWFLNLVNKINDIEFNNILIILFSKMFKLDNNQIKFKTSKLSKKIQKDKNKVIQFTDDQNMAITKIFEFIPDFNEKTFGLYGYAGTGKTTIIVEIISYLIKKRLLSSVAFSAPTNQATDVIKSKFKKYIREIYYEYYGTKLENNFNFDETNDKLLEKGIKIDFITIHKLLKMERDYDIDGEIIFIRNNGDSIISQYELIIIDECSMIPAKLIENIFVELKYKKQKGSDNYQKMPKVIFCGDPAQLPPVNEKVGIIFLKDKQLFSLTDYKHIIKSEESSDTHFESMKQKAMTNRYDFLIDSITTMPTIVLKQVMRSNLKSVTQVCYQFRLWTMDEVKVPDIYSYVKDGVYTYHFDKKSKIETEWFKKCLEYFNDKKACNIILTWTNKQAIEYNQEIRKMIFKNDKIGSYVENDILILNGFYNFDENEGDYTKESGDKLYTSQQIKIIKITEIDKQINEIPITLSKKAMKLQHATQYNNLYKQTIENINKTTTRNYKCWKMIVKKLPDNHNNTNTIYVIHDESKKKWETEYEYICDNIKKMSNTLTKKYRDKKHTIEYNIIRPLWRNVNKMMTDPFANVNYGYAITCHKSQGSDCYNVFVDIHDILKNNNQDETKKCLYTAVTRTSNELHMLL